MPAFARVFSSFGWYVPLHARGLNDVIEGEQLAPIDDLM
jgi:hypothetical protein